MQDKPTPQSPRLTGATPPAPPPEASISISQIETADLIAQLKEHCRRAGFTGFGLVPATEAETFGQFEAFLDAGYHGEMGYLERHRDARRHPASMLPDARTVVMLALPYRVAERPSTAASLAPRDRSRTDLPETPASSASPPSEPGPSEPGPSLSPTGRISRYAQGEADYHDLIRGRLKTVQSWLKQAVPGIKTRAVVDTAPLLERDFARRAGLGWVGKNTMLISPEGGSYLFLAAILTDQEWTSPPPSAPSPPRSTDGTDIMLAPGDGLVTDHCGACTACLDACPTDAFPAPRVLDATRCLSYWTIEAKSLPPLDIREQWTDWIFGCDVCNEVCPWNGRSLWSLEPRFAPSPQLPWVLPGRVDLVEILTLDEASFTTRFGRTPIARTGRTGLLRNAALACGAGRHRAARSALEALLAEPDATLREAARWALDRIDASGSPSVSDASDQQPVPTAD